MGKQDAYIKIKNLLDEARGEEGQCIKNYFNIPDEDENEDWNEVIEVKGSYNYPLCHIDDAIKVLKEAKEKGCNFVHIYDHGDHGEINFEGYLIEKLTDAEVVEYKAELDRNELERKNRILQKEKEEFERLRKKFG
jgi:nucleoside-diphosphate-sugar epimerase